MSSGELIIGLRIGRRCESPFSLVAGARPHWQRRIFAELGIGQRALAQAERRAPAFDTARERAIGAQAGKDGGHGLPLV